MQTWLSIKQNKKYNKIKMDHTGKEITQIHKIVYSIVFMTNCCGIRGLNLFVFYWKIIITLDETFRLCQWNTTLLLIINGFWWIPVFWCLTCTSIQTLKKLMEIFELCVLLCIIPAWPIFPINPRSMISSFCYILHDVEEAEWARRCCWRWWDSLRIVIAGSVSMEMMLSCCVGA